MPTHLPFSVCAHVTAELRELVTSMLAARRGEAALTLHDVRLALQQDSRPRLEEGELSHSQDRTALLIEIDELIDQHGATMPAAALLPVLPT